MVIWPDAWLIHRNSECFPNPEDFLPERWLPSSSYGSIKTGAFRPFERGPRNCVGQEFGMLEMKIVMALCLKEIEFEPVDDGMSAVVDGMKCYQMLFGSAKPKGFMRGRVGWRRCVIEDNL